MRIDSRLAAIPCSGRFHGRRIYCSIDYNKILNIQLYIKKIVFNILIKLIRILNLIKEFNIILRL